ncbi:MAG: SpoIIE family protein phosphatase [Bdellovibrionaceae bacterium]|nr:SpoIIE family protein phosphatase [Pseudobdellovibrionaceae bacterium]
MVEYKKDKIAYVFDTALQSSKNTSLMVSADIDSSLKKVEYVLRRPLDTGFQLTENTKRFIRSEKSIVGFYILKMESNNKFKIVSSESQPQSKLTETWLDQISVKAFSQEFYITRAPDSDQSWVLALQIAKNSGYKILAVAEFAQANFMENFYKPKIQNFYLLNSKNELILKTLKPQHQISEDSLQQIILESQLDANSVTAVKNIKTKQGTFLVASALVSIGGYRVLSVIPESIALEALQVMTINTGLLLVMLLGIAIIVSVLGASTLTQNLSKLYIAVNKIIKGELDTKVSIQSKDEVGVLATGFNLMTAKIQELLQETAEKARMEGELKTAKTVQSTLFPKDNYKNENFEVFGFYEPASECGGDWYSYTVFNNRAYFWIGDATGHGVSAALITSAAKSASTVIQTLPNMKTSEIMSLMNSAVAQTSGGNVLMTFFIGCLDYKTGLFTYTNASHDTPYLFKKMSQYKRKNITPIMGESGPRLGQDLTSSYSECEIQLEPGDRLFFYTDGLPEITKSSGQQWGEGNFLRALLKAFNEYKSVKNISSSVLNEANDFRGDEILHDDVTFFTMEYFGSNGV